MSKKSLFLLLIVPFIFLASNSGAQSILGLPQETAQKKDSVIKIVRAIPLNRINNVSTESFTLFNQVTSNLLTAEEKSKLSGQVDNILEKTGIFFADTSLVSLENLNFREMEVLNNSKLLLQNEITTLHKAVDVHLNELEANEELLMENKERWEITYKEQEGKEAPPAILRRISNILSKNDSVLRILQNDIDFLLTQSDLATGEEIKIDQFERDLESKHRLNSSNVLRRDMPPIWAYLFSRDSIEAADHWQYFRSNFADETNLLVREYSGRMILIVVFFALLVILVFWLRATVMDPKVMGKKVFLSLYINEIFRKPFEVSILLGIYLIFIVIPEMPTAYSSILFLISVYAILRLALNILPHGYKKFLLGFAVGYILLRFYDLFYDQTFSSRMILLIAQSFTMVSLISFLISRSRVYTKKKGAFSTIVSALSGVYLFFIVVAVAGNILGILSLSEFLSSGIIRSGFLVITTYVGFYVSTGVVYLLLKSSLFKGSNIIKKQSSYIFGRIYRLLRLFFIFSWFLIAIDHFKVRSHVVEWIREFFNRELSIGEASFALINIFLFFFVIWLSVWISRIIRQILMEEVYTRIKVERGIPGTINMLLRIALISIGFLLAAAAAGMELSNLTIIIGAFSVGIGFGLQNIFNNLVSGLILAFERPIKEGDIVEVNAVLGTVKKIGIRSSIVRTFSGAEVIVPNGELIANDLINWTLSDQFRRSDLRVGVAYGTDPERVIEILLRVARENKRVNEEPLPQAFFIEFGDSSLNFKLLAWIDQVYRFEVESELMVEINRKLKEAGIEIPFPQRDLHVKTISSSAGEKLKGGK